jgi:hypothetical protein
MTARPSGRTASVDPEVSQNAIVAAAGEPTG